VSITDSKTRKAALSSVSLKFCVIAFLFIFSVILTLSPTVRYRSFDVTLQWSHWIGFLIWAVGYLLFDKSLSKYLIRKDPILTNSLIFLIGWGILTIWRLRWYFGLRQSIWFLVCVLFSFAILQNKAKFIKLRNYKYLGRVDIFVRHISKRGRPTALAWR